MRYLVLFFIAIITLNSCQKEADKSSSVDYAVVTGNIKNLKSDKLEFMGLTSSFKKAVELNDGKFVDTLNIDAGNYMIYDGGYLHYVYLEPGTNIHLTYDGKQPYETMNFTGNGSEENNYLVKKREMEKRIVGKGVNVYKLDENEYVNTQKQIRDSITTLVAENPKLDEAFKEKEKRHLNYHFLDRLNTYEKNHRYYTKDTSFTVSDNFRKHIRPIDMDREDDFKFSSSYVSLISDYIKKEAEKLTMNTNIADDVAYLKIINTFENQAIKNQLLFKNAENGITRTSDLDNYYNEFMNGSTDEEHKNVITDRYKILTSVTKGKASPKFIDYENSAGGTTSLDDFKGKYVYIDVWATWCAPCKAEIPYLQQIEEAYKDKNIEFVSISVDRERDHDKWKTMVEEEGLKGVQLIADNNFESQFIQDYYIKSIPKFILLDPNGIIVDANAPRPSNDKLKSLLDDLNI